MLKISKPLSVQKVSEYYKFEYGSPDQAYYAEGKQLVGEWHGRLAAEFGLAGAVAAEQYTRLTAGQHPWTAEQLIKHRPPVEDCPAWLRKNQHLAAERPKKHLEHIAAWDWTLAPHKSFSVTALVGGDRELIEDHKKAVRTA